MVQLQLFTLLLILFRVGKAAHQPNSSVDWDYGQYILGLHPCISNGTTFFCQDYIHRGSNQTWATAAYNLLHNPPGNPPHNHPGDWTELNNLLKNITLTLPDFTTSITEGFVVATIHLTQLKCGSISIVDLELVPTRPNDQHVSLEISVTGLTLSCAADWVITTTGALGVHGNGALTANSLGSAITSQVLLLSSDFEHLPPSSSTDASCKSDVVISDLEFTGGTLATILGWFKATIIKELTTTINPLLCHELTTLVDDSFASLLVNISHLIDPYLTQEALVPPNVAERERALIDTLANKQDHLVSLSSNHWMAALYNLTQSLLGWNGTEHKWGINGLIDQWVPNGVLNLSNLSLVLYDSAATSTATPSPVNVTIVLASVVVKGLDSFTHVNLLNPIGNELNYTLLNEFSMQGITLEVGIELEMVPRQGGIIGSQGHRNTNAIQESIQVEVSIEQLDFNATVVLALDGKTLSTTSLGNILNDPTGCLLDSIEIFNVTSLSLNIDHLSPIAIEGFVSCGGGWWVVGGGGCYSHRLYLYQVERSNQAL